MKHLSKYLLAIIIALALFLRIFELGNLPPSLTWDEVAWGYNAYSLGLTASDEFGKFLPLAYIESFGDFKPPMYAYLDVLPIKIFGLTEFAVRLPSATFGVLSVMLTFFLVKEIFGKEKEKLALVSSFLLAISPWHIMLSRAAFEANVAVLFTILGVLLFLKSAKNPYLLSFSAVSFVLSMYTFNSPRIVVPILVAAICIISYKRLLKIKAQVILAFLIGLILFIPLLLFLLTPQAKLRFEEVNIFSDIGVINRTNAQIANDNDSSISRLIHNRRLTYGVEYLRHYMDNLSPQFLFIKGDGNPKFSIQDVGQLYIWEIPFLIAGLILVFRKREKNWWIIPMLLVIGIIPAGFARETPHALRIESVLPSFQVLTAVGVIAFLEIVKWRRVVIFIMAFVVISNFVYFVHNYFFHYSNQFSKEWQYGYKDSIEYINNEKNRYKKVYLTEALGRAYIYYLFYSKVDPRSFQNDSSIFREALGFVHVTRYKNIYFDDLVDIKPEEKTLYIGSPDEVPLNVKKIQEFKLKNGKTVLIAFTL